MDKAKNILTSIVGLLMLAFFCILIYKEIIIWWHFLSLMIGLGVFLVFYFNFDRIEELLLESRKSKIFIKMARERIERARRELDTLREHPKAKPKVPRVAEVEKVYTTKPRRYIDGMTSVKTKTGLIAMLDDLDDFLDDTQSYFSVKRKSESGKNKRWSTTKITKT